MKKKHSIEIKVFRQDKNFSTRLPYANEKNEKSFFSKMNTKYKTGKVLNIKLQSLKGKTRLKFHQQYK